MHRISGTPPGKNDSEQSHPHTTVAHMASALYMT